MTDHEDHRVYLMMNLLQGPYHYHHCNQCLLLYIKHPNL